MRKIIDTHCHPYLNKIKKSDEIINNFFSWEWEAMIVIWTNIKSNKKVLELVKKNPRIYATLWIHPCDIWWLEINDTIKNLEKTYLENKEKIVAIWECWLDYYWIYKDLENNNLSEEENEKIILKQKKDQELFFREQIKLAKKYYLPFIIHNRNSKDDVLKILKDEGYKNFIFHCYSEDLYYANEILEFAPESYLSFSWIVTFNNAKDIQETARNIPIKNILAETDSPYLTPVPFRWKEENEPIFTKYVIEKIAELRWEKDEIIYEEIFKNSLRVFKIDN